MHPDPLDREDDPTVADLRDGSGRADADDEDSGDGAGDGNGAVATVAPPDPPDLFAGSTRRFYANNLSDV